MDASPTTGRERAANDAPDGKTAGVANRRPGRSLIPGTIRGKLFLVFAVIILAAAIGAVVAQRANILVETQLSLITEDNLPSLVTAHRISEATTNIRSVAAAMATSESTAALTSRRTLLSRHIETAKSVVVALGNTGTDPETTSRLNSQVAEVEDLAAQLAAMVGRRLELADELQNSLQQLATEHLQFNEAIRPLVAKELSFLDQTSARVVSNTEATVAQLNAISLRGLIPLLSIGAQIAPMEAALRRGAAATSEDGIDDAWSAYVAASAIIGRNINALERNKAVAAVIDVQQLTDSFDRLLSFGTGDDSVFERRRRALTRAAARTASRAADFETSFNDFERFLQLSITLIRGETVTIGIDLNREISSSLTAMNKASVDDYGALLRLEALGNRAVGILTVASFAENLAGLAPLRAELLETNEEFESVLGRMGGVDDVSGTVDRARRMMGFGKGDGSIPELRAGELRLLQSVEGLLFRTNALTQRMSLVSADIVNSAQERATSAASQVVRSLDSSRVTLSLALGLSLLAMLGAVVYVNRSLGSRLSAFSNATLALAEGDLRVNLPDPAGQDEISRLMRALAVFRDTAVEMEESNLREIALMRQRLIDAIESITEGFAFFDSDERLVIANSRYRDDFLRGVREVVAPGVPLTDILQAVVQRGLIADSAQDPERWLEWRLRQFRQPGGPFVLEYTDGSWVQVNERKTADGGTVVVYSDITDLKQREFQLTQAKEEAEAANEAKSNFLANVSHELRTPLTSILGFARIVQKRFQSAVMPQLGTTDGRLARAVGQIEHNLEIILLEGDRLTKLVNDVLDLEKIEAGEMVWNVTELDIAEVIAQATAATESLYRQKGLDFAAEVAADLPPVLGDRDRVVQVLVNLISNAVKFTEAGSVTCRAWPDEASRVHVSVTDSGMGIAPEDHAAIFEKFRQVGDTLTEKPAGTGLGLPICREIIEHLGGEIGVDSELGRGSTFTFWLPVAPSDVTAAAAP